MEQLEFLKNLSGRYRDFSCTPYPHLCEGSPVVDIISQSGTFVMTDEPAVTYHNHPKSIVYIRIYSRYYTLNGLGQMYNDKYHMEYFHCPKNPHLFSPSLPTPGNLVFLPFPRIRHLTFLECHSVGIL